MQNTPSEQGPPSIRAAQQQHQERQVVNSSAQDEKPDPLKLEAAQLAARLEQIQRIEALKDRAEGSIGEISEIFLQASERAAQTAAAKIAAEVRKVTQDLTKAQQERTEALDRVEGRLASNKRQQIQEMRSVVTNQRRALLVAMLQGAAIMLGAVIVAALDTTLLR